MQTLLKHILIQALVLIYLSAGNQSEPVTDLNLNGKSFKLEASYQRASKDGSIVTYEIEEFHSAWQQRSRLHYKLHDLTEKGEAQRKKFLSNERVVLMMDSTRTANCALVFPIFLDQLFELNVLEGFEHSHLIGTARLLSFIEQNFDKFSTETNYQDGNKYELRRAAFRRGGNVHKIDLFYSTDQKENLPNGIPRKLTISNTDLEQRLSYDFLRFQPLKDHFQSSTSNAACLNQYADYDSNSASFDLFHFNRAIGCSKVLEMGSGDKLNLTGHDSARFSFNARPTFQDRPLYDVGVIYEADLAVLLVQQFLAGASANNIVDFKANRNYHTTKQFSAETQLEPMLGAGERRDFSCFVNRVTDDKHDSDEHEASNQFKSSVMLFGTERLVYLGLARVRGIVARVYESHHCDWPVWLQVPSIFEEAETMPNFYQKADGKLMAEIKLRRRDEVKLMKRHGISMTNVFYFSQTTSGQQDLDAAKLLLVELFWNSDSTGALIRTISIPIYDFSWNLQSSSPLGGRYEDSLSLQDSCFASTNTDSDFAAINFKLKARVDWEKQNWLMGRASRNVALLRMAQSSLHLNPVSMIYDIESRLDLGGARGKGAESDRFVSLSVSMRAATRTKSIARLLFICMAHLNLVYFEAYQVLNFEACRRIAAQRQADTIFAFDIRSSKCQIIQPVFLETNELKTMLQNICVFGQRSGPYEVYTIFHHNELILRAGDPFEGLPAVWSRLHSVRAPQLHNPHSMDDSNSAIAFELIDGHVRRLNGRIGHNQEHYPVSSKKFPGFGLLESDAQNKLVRPAPSEERDIENQGPSSMSFEHCQTACLRDFDCRTYSVCFSRGELRCIVTSVSFAEPEIVNQLTQLREVKAKFGQEFQLKVGTGGQTAQVVKHPNCELHVKFYENYFKHDTNVLHTLPISKRSAIVVATREQCAELCFRSTINYLKELNQFGAREEQSNSDTNLGGKNGCFSYYYLDSLRIDSKVLGEISAQSSVDGSHQEIDFEDFCFLNELVSEEDEAKEVERKTSSNQKDIEFERFVFDYTNLYSKQAGISLVESADSINRSTTTDNFGSLKNCFGPPECARLCFNSKAQVGQLKCRSFDYIEVTAQTGLIQKYCAFNSVSFKSSLEAQRYDLIRYGSNRQERVPTDSSEVVLVWHYEPRDLIALQSTDRVNLISLGHAPNHRIHLAGFSLFCLVAVFIITGAAIGFALSSRLLSRTKSEDSRKLLGI